MSYHTVIYTPVGCSYYWLDSIVLFDTWKKIKGHNNGSMSKLRSSMEGLKNEKISDDYRGKTRM